MKNTFKISLLAIALFLFNNNLKAQTMNNQKLDEIIRKVGDSVNGKLGSWQFKFNDALLMIITDENHNRMRIMAPITEMKNLDEADYIKSLEANFHTVLDAKYAISDEIMWSVFIHPLKELSEGQVKDAINQVYLAAATFGSSYTSSDLVFPSIKN